MGIPNHLLDKMLSPGAHRNGVWRNGVLQVKVINACDLDCKHCSVGVGLAKKLKKVFRMTPSQFREALQSLRGYDGVIGMFGGNPCIHPQFEELCVIFREEVPNKDQRGLWSNRLFGHGAICRETFSPEHSNLNVHGSQDAWDEMRETWPESRPLAAGLGQSLHGPIFGSAVELGLSEHYAWESVAKCYVNQTWSAEITVVDGELLGYFCEIAGTMAELEGDPRHGYDLVEGWWSRGMAEFKHQVEHYCSRCLVSFNLKKIDAAGDEPEQYTNVWSPVMLSIKGRPLVEIKNIADHADGAPATKYLQTGVMPQGM